MNLGRYQINLALGQTMTISTTITLDTPPHTACVYKHDEEINNVFIKYII